MTKGLAKELRTFGLFCAISFVLFAIGVAIWTYEFRILGQTNGPVVGTAWLWVFALPVMAACTPQVGLRDWWPALFVINTFIYGGTWWLVWRM